MVTHFRQLGRDCGRVTLSWQHPAVKEDLVNFPEKQKREIRDHGDFKLSNNLKKKRKKECSGKSETKDNCPVYSPVENIFKNKFKYVKVL